MIETNLGIADGLRCLIPQNKDMLIYGRPWHLLEERATLELARFCARRSAAFVDVGAHEGMFTFFIASDIARPRPFAFHLFEPDAAIFERLSQNLVRNNVDARANNVAVSDYNGRQTFYRNITQDAMGSLTTYFAATDETVAVETNVTSLAHYLQSQNIERACVKVDVETAGVAVWNGARPALDRISWLIFEISGPEHKAGLPARIVAETGWSAYYIRDFELVRSIDGAFTHRAPFYNWLFCGDDPPALASILRETRFRVIEATRA